MTRRLSLLGVLCCLGCGAGAGPTAGVRPGADAPFQLRETADPQEAVFFTARGWTGGMGQPVLDAGQALVTLSGTPVYLDPRAEQAIAQRGRLPGAVSGPERIRAEAKVRLERRTAPNESVPGSPSTTYYALVIEELHDVSWEGQRAD
jgi:hypothetical protein